MVHEWLHHYLISEGLGEDAFGAVYLAEDMKFKRWVVLRIVGVGVMQRPFFTTLLQQIASQIINLEPHPYLVKLNDFEHQDQPYYLDYAYVGRKARTLKERLEAVLAQPELHQVGDAAPGQGRGIIRTSLNQSTAKRCVDFAL